MNNVQNLSFLIKNIPLKKWWSEEHITNFTTCLLFSLLKGQMEFSRMMKSFASMAQSFQLNRLREEIAESTEFRRRADDILNSPGKWQYIIRGITRNKCLDLVTSFQPRISTTWHHMKHVIRLRDILFNHVLFTQVTAELEPGHKTST